jgi:dihydroxyacetone kinase-like protein
MGLGDLPADKRELTFEEFVAAFAAGIGKLQKQSRAQVGDKTMMDAFLPALAALQAASPAAGIQAALAQAAAAAAAGADATRSMKAKFGRARNLGDRVLGHPDPGAVSVSLLFQGFSEGIPPSAGPRRPQD